jgi:hypothetical protein
MQARAADARLRLDGQHELAKDAAVDHRRERAARLVQRHRFLDDRPDALLDAEPHEPLELVARAHCGADDRQLQEEDPQ